MTIPAVIAVFVVASWVRSRWLGAQRPDGTRARPARRHPPTEGDWASVLDSIAAEVRGGSSLYNAVAHVASGAGITGAVLTATSTLPDITSSTSSDPAEAVVLQTIIVASELGGSTAGTLDSGAALLRERAAVRAELAVHAAQARLSARVLTAVPLGFAAWSLLASRSFRVAVGSPTGATCVVLGLCCNLVGWWWMRRIVASAW